MKSVNEPEESRRSIVLAGPFTDGSGSLIVVDAESREEVWAMVARDPYVVHGVFNRVEVLPFKQVFPATD